MKPVTVGATVLFRMGVIDVATGIGGAVTFPGSIFLIKSGKRDTDEGSHDHGKTAHR